MLFCLHFYVGDGDLENKDTQKQEDSAVLIEWAGTETRMKPRRLTVAFAGGTPVPSTLMVE